MIFQKIKHFVQCVAQTPIKMPTEIITIASDMDTSDVTYDVNEFINNFVIEHHWLYDNITIGTDINYILFITMIP